MFEKIVEFVKDMLGMNAKVRLSQRHSFIIQFKGTAVGKLTKEDLDEIGYFDTYGTSGSALQGSTELSRSELYDYLQTKFGLTKEEINIISPLSFWGAT